MNRIRKLPNLSYENTNIGFVFWFIAGLLLTIICYHPFNQPILFDRAYLLHMSQVVYRGDGLYEATTFGYTPISTLVVGFFMKLGSIFSMDTITSARVFGLLMYGTLCGSFFILVKSLFNSKWPTWIACTLFCGLGYIQLLSSVNAEPKIWVMLFSIWGIYFYKKQNWLLVGLVLSLAAMSWHVSVISLVAAAVMLPWRSDRFVKCALKLALGVFIGTLPVILYLAVTDSWVEFWNQAVLRKLIVEASTAGESPLQWIREGIYPYFILEPLHFVFAVFGFVLACYAMIKRRIKSSIDISLLKFVMVYTLIWVLFNSYDFQTCVDMLPLIPAIVIFATYFLITVIRKPSRPVVVYVLGVVFIGYNFLDALMYKVAFAYTQQKAVMKEILDKHGDPFAVGFEEYYTILEKPMPTKFMRYAYYEDHMIEQNPDGFKGITKQITTGGYGTIVEYDKNKRVRSDASKKLFQYFPDRDQRKFGRSKCTTYLIDELTNNQAIDSFQMRVQTIPWSDKFYIDEYYSVFGVE